MSLSEPLPLPCGAVLPNRLVRAAMTESIADRHGDASPRHERLYRAAAEGGPGLVITGNVMVDRAHLERARNVVVDSWTDDAALRRWAQAASAVPTIVQLSHPGRQTTRFVNPHPVGPSTGPAVALGGAYARPRGLSVVEIADLQDRFVEVAERVVDAGFAGVQVHAAHGYLLSSFLDPGTNRRTDLYGGSLLNRARFLLGIVTAMRRTLPASAILAVKLDARDDDELAELGPWLEDAGVDLLEVSGGNYEKPAMVGLDASGADLAGEHESPFWNSAAALSVEVDVPVVLTGGFRSRAEVDEALETGVCDAVGVGRPLAVRPELAGRFVRGEIDTLDRPAPRLGGPAPVRALLGAAVGAGWHRIQLVRTSRGRGPALRLPALAAGLDYSVGDWVRSLVERPARMRRARRF
ncbi:NADH:flavin oxidoreductase/NADH oxidase family protein [Actinomycetospora corticicola]|uniref:2,4-dienoyl-CoA reductase-like NADH-dependent reductase (Old Yellow Enzyme family) n=1 Tax=Actinomycetospora corticicola TaxID=663602 RepID=A0A7Y9DSK8_9PSEU|nr:2,4-dienoyl-CoA reductase-like NADH-dependent reductase (Old Yellow Enzyme family) [Actinomycetospora corticicola]